MSKKLFEKLEEERRAGRVTTVHDWLAEHPPPDDAYTQTLACVADRVRSGEPFLHATREFLDEFSIRQTPELRSDAILQRPATTGDRAYDAYLAALAEHLATIHGLERPGWVYDPDRFLDHFWFVSDIKGFRAIAIAESPAAFRRRGIFVAKGSLDRC